MQVDQGTRLGPYEIVSRLGAGGMGEVWRATDTRLDRSVAIKVLPPAFAQNAQLQIRFEREARAISQLNHPNICTLHDVGESEGVHFLVMELLDGESLAARIARGPLPTTEVLRFGSDIATALDRAHRQGIVHRDLKPANVMLTRSGVKLLDFGLARTGVTAEKSSAVASRYDDATKQRALTHEGTVLGTFQYMAPEQVAGEEADARSDIFALGAVLYEMATGQAAFQGKTRTSLIAAIVGGEPRPLRELQPLTPPGLEHVIRKSLEKDPDERWQSAHDIAEELRWIGEGGSQAEPSRAPVRMRERLGWGIASVGAAIAGVFGTQAFERWRAPVRPFTESSISLPVGSRSAILAGTAISPDASAMVAVLDDERGVRALWIRPMDSSTFRRLEGTTAASNPFWSPDSRTIGFFAAGNLLTIDPAGSTPRVICKAAGARGGTWSRDGTILFSSGEILMKVESDGGVPVSVTRLGPGEFAHRWPWFLPDGNHFLYVVLSAPRQPAGIYRASLDEPGRTKLVVQGGSSTVVVGDYILYGRNGSVVAQKFNSRTGTVSGAPVPIIDGVATTERASINLSAAADGTVITQRGAGFLPSRLILVDRTGAEKAAVSDADLFFSPRLSHDGRRVVVDRSNESDGQGDLWVYDLTRSIRERLTFKPDNESGPIWSSDDRRIYFHRGVQGQSAIERVAPGGTGQTETLLVSEGEKRLTDVSSDGRWVVFDQIGSNFTDIWLYEQQEGKARPWLATPFNELAGAISPDGKWIVYQSDESGRDEIYVRDFPDSERKWLISNGGGSAPTWRGDGREIYYLTPEGRMMAVGVTAGEELQTGAPAPLFSTRLRVHAVRQYDVSPDGSRFLLNRVDETHAQPLALITNWTSKLPK